MDKEVLSFVVEKTHELMNAASCSKEAKASAQTWLDAVGTENEAAATKTYIAELEADIMPVDGLIGFAESEMGAQVFGQTRPRKWQPMQRKSRPQGQNTVIVLPAQPQRPFLKRRMAFSNKNTGSDMPYIGHIVYQVCKAKKSIPRKWRILFFALQRYRNLTIDFPTQVSYIKNRHKCRK